MTMTVANRSGFWYSQAMIEPVPATSDRPVTKFPWLLFVESILWVGALEIAIVIHRLGLYIAAGYGVFVILIAIWQWRRRSSTNVATLAMSYIVVASIASLSFVPGPWPQHVIVAASTLLLWFVGQQRQRLHDNIRGRIMSFATAVLTWLSWYSLLSASIYLNIRIGWLVGGAGIITAAAALLVWLESGLSFKQCRGALVAMLWFGAEVFLVTWWLPTAIIVGSTVGATIIALVIQAGRHLLRGHWEPTRSKRYLTVGITIVVVALATARWT